MADLPSGTLTFLFTDIAGSTRLWEQHPQAMAGALARHDAILRQAIAEAGVVYKVIGDAFQAAFVTAPAACAAALAAQHALANEAWGVVGAVPVRMALHTCAAEPTEGDYRTGALNRLGRLLGAIHGGQIVLSQSTADLVRDALPPSVTLRDLGERQLRDLRPEPVFQLVAPDLPRDFPPLKTLDRPRHNLPAQPNMLIGRAQDVAAVRERLLRHHVRMLTLTGPGGTGKTRLGVQAAVELLDDFTDGVWFVNLAPISDPSLVAATVAQALGVREMGEQPIQELLKSYLRAKRLLLLLDNFEQVADAAPLIGELLAAAPELHVLVTSRAALHLSAEREYAVPPLALPDRTQLPEVERLTQYAAVQLFIARAQAVKADFTVTNANAPAVAEICSRLDGLPLAIELAAARSKLFPPHALLTRLGNRLKLLTGGARDLPERQQTIRNAIDWSYNLLNAGEQTLFARLGVFVGGCTLEAAEAVCTADNDLPLDVIDGVAALVDTSLLRQEDGAGDEPRITMLETIREYALERLEVNGEADVLRQRHARYYRGLAEAAEPELYGPQQILWAERLDRDHDNLRAAIAWCITSGSDEQGWRLAGALLPFWEMRGYLIEGWTHLATALSLNGTHIPTGPRTVARAKALTSAAVLALWGWHDLPFVPMLLMESLAIQRELDNQLGIAQALVGFGNLERYRDNFTGSAPFYEEGLALFRAIGDTHGCALSLLWLGQVARYQGQFERAEILLSESLALFQQVGDIHGRAMVLLVMGETARFQHDYARATAIEQECLTLFRQTGAKVFAVMTELNLGFMAHHQGNDAQATTYFAGGLSFGWEFGTSGEIVLGLIGLGIVAGVQQPERAARLFGAVAKLLDSMDAGLEPSDRADYESGVATARAQLGDAAFAAAWAAGRTLTLEQAIAYALEQPRR